MTARRLLSRPTARGPAGAPTAWHAWEPVPRPRSRRSRTGPGCCRRCAAYRAWTRRSAGGCPTRPRLGRSPTRAPHRPALRATPRCRRAWQHRGGAGGGLPGAVLRLLPSAGARGRCRCRSRPAGALVLSPLAPASRTVRAGGDLSPDVGCGSCRRRVRDARPWGPGAPPAPLSGPHGDRSGASGSDAGPAGRRFVGCAKVYGTHETARRRVVLRRPGGEVPSVPTDRGRPRPWSAWRDFAAPTAGPLDQPAGRPALRRRMGRQFQDAALPDRLRVGEAVRLFAAVGGHRVDTAAAPRRVGARRARHGPRSPACSGSAGPLPVALALVNDPQLVFLAMTDYWFLLPAGPPGSSDAYGRAAPPSSWSPTDAGGGGCHRLVVLRNGAVVATGTPRGNWCSDTVVPSPPPLSPQLPPAAFAPLPRVRGVRQHGGTVEGHGERPCPPAARAPARVRGTVRQWHLVVRQATLEDAYISLVTPAARVTDERPGSDGDLPRRAAAPPPRAGDAGVRPSRTAPWSTSWSSGALRGPAGPDRGPVPRRRRLDPPHTRLPDTSALVAASVGLISVPDAAGRLPRAGRAPPHARVRPAGVGGGHGPTTRGPRPGRGGRRRRHGGVVPHE